MGQDRLFNHSLETVSGSKRLYWLMMSSQKNVRIISCISGGNVFHVAMAVRLMIEQRAGSMNQLKNGGFYII